VFELRFPLFAEPEGVEGTGSISDDVALLETETETETEPETEPETETEPEPEIEPSKDDEYKTEVSHPFDRPTVKDITTKFPEFFKTFPSIRDMYFREAEFSKVFPTIEDARDADRDAGTFRDLRDDLVSNKGAALFQLLDREKALDGFSRNFFSNLIATNKEAFWGAANPLVEDIARNMFAKGAREGDENIQNAARHLAEYFFGDLSVAEGRKTFVQREDPVKIAESKAAEKYDNERYLSFRAELSGTIRSEINKMVNEGDKLSGLSTFLKGVVADKVADQIGDILSKDQAHLKHMDGLWDRAKRNGRTDEDKSRLTSAFLGRAKSLIPSLRAKLITEITGKGPEASAEKMDKVAKVAARSDSAQGRPSSTSRPSYNPRKIDYGKTSDLDILNDDITYKS
jgi:hypothetical protein